jgi:predicted DNA-binding transcriptional regulator YafY
MPSPTAFDAFTEDEVNALWLGLLLTLRQWQSSDEEDDEDEAPSNPAVAGLLRKLEAWRRQEILATPVMLAPKAGRLPVEGLDREALKAAIRDERKLSIAYVDGKGRATERVVWPLSHTPFGPAGAMLAWCEKRGGFRNFRFDRIRACRLTDERMPTPRAVLLRLAECDSADDEGW